MDRGVRINFSSKGIGLSFASKGWAFAKDEENYAASRISNGILFGLAVLGYVLSCLSLPILGLFCLILGGGIYLLQKNSRGQRAQKYAFLGQQAFEKKQYSTALYNFERALELNRKFYSLYAILGDLYGEQEDFHSAEEYYRKYLAKKPYEHEIRLKLALALLEIQEFAQAAALLEELPEKWRVTTQVINSLAYSLMKLNRFDSALAVLEKGAAKRRTLDDQELFFHYLLGLAYHQVGDREKALEEYNKVIQEEKDFIDVQYRVRQLA